MSRQTTQRREATRPSFVQAPARAQMRQVAARAQNHQPGWVEPCSRNAWLSRSAVVDDSLHVVRCGRLAWTSREVRSATLSSHQPSELLPKPVLTHPDHPPSRPASQISCRGSLLRRATRAADNAPKLVDLTRWGSSPPSSPTRHSRRECRSWHDAEAAGVRPADACGNAGGGRVGDVTPRVRLARRVPRGTDGRRWSR